MSEEINVAGATEALESAGGFSHLMETQGDPTPAATTDNTQQSQTVPVEGMHRDPQTGRWVAAQPAQPDQQQAPAQPTTTAPTQPETFTGVDPNSLPDEVKPLYRSMLADYTRKTQEIAEQRRQFESLGDLNYATQAVEVYQQLQDPTNWPAFHQELSDALQEQGLTPAQANEAASQEVARQAGNEQPTADGMAALANDPDLAPIKTLVEGLQNKVSGLEAQYATQQEAQQVEQLEQAVIGELTRQENVIRQSNTHYTDGDVDAIYELSSFYDGNLLDAQRRYEELFNDRLGRYLSAKQGAAAAMPLTGAAQQSTTPPQNPVTDLDEAHKLAMERIKQLEAAGQL